MKFLTSLATFAAVAHSINIDDFKSQLKASRMSDRIIENDSIFVNCPYVRTRKQPYGFRTTKGDISGTQRALELGNPFKGETTFWVSFENLRGDSNTVKATLFSGVFDYKCPRPEPTPPPLFPPIDNPDV